jgi:hypothetical protein
MDIVEAQAELSKAAARLRATEKLRQLKPDTRSDGVPRSPRDPPSAVISRG